MINTYNKQHIIRISTVIYLYILRSISWINEYFYFSKNNERESKKAKIKEGQIKILKV